MEFVNSLDDNALNWFAGIREGHGWLTPIMRDLSAVGGRYVLALLVLFAIGLLCSLRRYRTAGFIVIAALGALALSEALKLSIGRPRPPHADPIAMASDPSPSFPSGHSMLSAAIYLTLAMVATAVIPRWRVRAYVITSSLVLVGLIGVSRMYLGVHYLTDVVSGWALGLTWALICRWVEFRWVLRMEKRDAELRRNTES